MKRHVVVDLSVRVIFQAVLVGSIVTSAKSVAPKLSVTVIRTTTLPEVGALIDVAAVLLGPVSTPLPGGSTVHE